MIFKSCRFFITIGNIFPKLGVPKPTLIDSGGFKDSVREEGDLNMSSKKLKTKTISSSWYTPNYTFVGVYNNSHWYVHTMYMHIQCMYIFCNFATNSIHFFRKIRACKRTYDP